MSYDISEAETCFKNEGRKLQAFLKNRGLDLNYMCCLEAVAVIHGHKSWHHLQAWCRKVQPDSPADDVKPHERVYYELFEADGGFGFHVFDASRQVLITQSPTRNTPIAPLLQSEAERDAVVAVRAISALSKAPHSGCTVTYFRSEYGVGYRITLPNGAQVLNQPFAPQLAGYAAMTAQGALLFAEDAVANLGEVAEPKQH